MNKQKIDEILNDFSQKVEPVILELLYLNLEKKNHPLVNYQVLAGGKRLRPGMLLAVYKMLGGKGKKVFYSAASVEILHNYTLIIDDIIDHSTIRRGKPTVWKKYGQPMAQCIAVAYASSVFEKSERKTTEVFSSILKTIMAEGEILDILFEQTGREGDPYIVKNRYYNINKKDLVKMMTEKTAVLFQACCEIGGIWAKASRKEIDYLKDFGLNFGLAFQISDDILDIFGKEKEFGKKIGKDIEESKGGNCVIDYALKEFSDKQQKEFLTILRKKRKNKKDIARAVELIKKTKAREKAFQYGKRFVRKAKKSLGHFPENKYNDFLFSLTDSLMERKK